MSGPYAVGKHAFGFCDRCGFRYPLVELKNEVIALQETSLKVCPECWDPDNPQNNLGRFTFDDAQALRNPRPAGATSGREIAYTYRTDFETGLDNWSVRSGLFVWNSENQTGTLSSDPSGSNPGDPFIARLFPVEDDELGIDTSIYKYVTAMFKVNRFPLFEPDDRYASDFQGDCFFGEPWTTDRVVRASPVPVFTNLPTGSWTKLTWNMGSHLDWTGTVNALRLDFFDSRNEEGSGPDFDAGEIEISYIAVEDWSLFTTDPV